jgi:hypothetical protein
MKLMNKLITGGTIAAFAITSFAVAMPQHASANHYSQYNAEQKSQIIDLLLKLVVARSVDNQTMVNADGMSDAANLRVQLNKELQSHVSLALSALRNLYDENDQVDAFLAELEENTNDLGSSIGSVFGNDAEDEFEELWRDHIGFFANETIGLRENDEEMVEEARENLEQYAEDVADFFVAAMPSLDEDTLMAGANEHRMLLSGSMEAYDDEDYDEAYELQYEGEMQVKGLADALTTGITNRFPDQF